jgi:hypothetical protein
MNGISSHAAPSISNPQKSIEYKYNGKEQNSNEWQDGSGFCLCWQKLKKLNSPMLCVLANMQMGRGNKMSKAE